MVLHHAPHDARSRLASEQRLLATHCEQRAPRQRFPGPAARPSTSTRRPSSRPPSRAAPEPEPRGTAALHPSCSPHRGPRPRPCRPPNPVLAPTPSPRPPLPRPLRQHQRRASARACRARTASRSVPAQLGASHGRSRSLGDAGSPLSASASSAGGRRRAVFCDVVVDDLELGENGEVVYPVGASASPPSPPRSAQV